MKKGTVIALGVLTALLIIGKCGTEKALTESKARETAKRDAMTPAERAAADSVAANSERLKTLAARGRESVRNAKALATARLKDPESARFGRTWAGGDSMRVGCGYVNSKNGFGGYTGEKLYAGQGGGVVFEDDLPTLAGENRRIARRLLTACDTTITIR